MAGTIISEYATLISGKTVGNLKPAECAFTIYESALDTAAGNTTEGGGLIEAIPAGGSREALDRNAGHIVIAAALHLGALEVKEGLITAAGIIAAAIESRTAP